MEDPQGHFGDTEVAVTGQALYETEQKVRDGLKKRGDEDATEPELNDCLLYVRLFTVPATLCD